MVNYVLTIIMVHDTQTLDVWYIYLYLVNFYGRCRYINHTWILWDSLYHRSSMIFTQGTKHSLVEQRVSAPSLPRSGAAHKANNSYRPATDSQSQGVKDKGVPKFCWGFLLGVRLGFQLYYTILAGGGVLVF